jgi:hypothetical protein
MALRELNLGNGSAECTELLDQVDRLEVKDKIALICHLIAHLETSQIQQLLEFSQQEIATRQEHIQEPTSATIRQTALLLKKDYSYQKRGLNKPTQYYVYLRRRKPKLDRYIGTLFYVDQGTTLSYQPDAEGRIIFTPPHNLFILTDIEDATIHQVVRLICLEPPPPDYTFTKQQDDTPEIYLHLEYLDFQSYELISEGTYAFPFCMYGGGALDRYRWNVSPLILMADDANDLVKSVESNATKFF